ncbi:high mobility group nucleosome-binding domain-containing protein 5-like [Ochlerotatus camptorhynchus]|uniref:high mobility group nucleosome-binding domain-containing protein 5-like n=1 Tax=Ochlerotatus camptorhynchus TaxID=644619 RepID=UPI0031D42BFB
MEIELAHARKIEDLYVFVKDKNNIHKEVKLLATVIKSGIAVADRELQEWRRRAEAAEKALLEAKENAMLAVAQETPKGPTNPRPEKRDRETPGDEEDPKKHKDDEYGDKEQEDGEDNDWRKVENQKEKRKKLKEEEQRKKEQKNKEEKEKKN